VPVTRKVSLVVVVVTCDPVPATRGVSGVCKAVSPAAGAVAPVPIWIFNGVVPPPFNLLVIMAFPDVVTKSGMVFPQLCQVVNFCKASITLSNASRGTVSNDLYAILLCTGSLYSFSSP